MSKDITINSPEFRSICDEVMKSQEAIKCREELSETSFRNWVCDVIQMIADQLGFNIQNMYEFTLDMVDAFTTGFNQGRERARNNSRRYRKE